MRAAGGKKFGRALLALGAAAMLAGCAQYTPTPGLGWSKAPDLSVYGTMQGYAVLAREQALLCDGWSPATAERHWNRDFGARSANVRAAMAARYGQAAVDRSAVRFGRVMPCDPPLTNQWREAYDNMLRVLELRMGLVGSRRG